MALQQFRNSAWHPISTLYAYRSGAWQRLKTLKVYSGGAWRLIGNLAPSLTVSAPAPADGASFNRGSATITSNAVTATPSGGISPYSYAWAKQSGGAVTAGSPTSATTTFSGVVPYDSTTVAVFRVTCTDSIGQTATADVSVTLENLPPS